MRVLYFALVRETIGRDEEELDLPPDIATVGEFVDWLKGRSPSHARALDNRDMIRAALDHEHVPLSAPLGGAREIALFPPMTGG